MKKSHDLCSNFLQRLLADDSLLTKKALLRMQGYLVEYELYTELKL